MLSLYQLRPTLATRELGWMLGMTLGAMSYGALLTLSINCIERLRRHPKGKKLWTQQHVFQGFIILVLIFNTVKQVENIRLVSTAILYTDPDKVTLFSWIPSDIVIVFTMMLTDGLLASALYPLHCSMIVLIATIGLEMLHGPEGNTWSASRNLPSYILAHSALPMVRHDR